MKHPEKYGANETCIWVCFLLFIGTAFASQDIPSPLGQAFPEGIPAGISMDASGEQVRKIECASDLSFPKVGLSETVGERFTFTFWFNTSRADLLEGGGWDSEVPMTMLHFKGEGDGEQMIVRLRNNHIALCATNDGGQNWPTLEGGGNLVADKWYFVVVTKDERETSVYINDVFECAGVKFPAIRELSGIVYGRHDARRFFQGDILRPRVYKGVLSREQIQYLYSQRPVEVMGAGEVFRYGTYPSLGVVKDELHPLIDHFNVGATLLQDPANPKKKNILLAGLQPGHFGSRVAFFKGIGNDAEGLPYYDHGRTLDFPATQLLARSDKEGTVRLYARSMEGASGESRLLSYLLTHYDEEGIPSFGDAQEVMIDGESFGEVFGSRICGWVLADIDGDGTDDLVVSSIKPEISDDAYWPDGLNMTSGVVRENSGPGRGYDIEGNWLGGKITSQLFWAKGVSGNGPPVSFGNKQAVYYRHEGFAAQWVTGDGKHAMNIITLQGRPMLVQSGDVDQLRAMPISVVNGNIILGKSAPLLTGDGRIHGSYFIHNISILEQQAEGPCRLLLDGTPGRLIVVEGDSVGAFRELGAIQTKGGAVAVDTLASPSRGNWDDDPYPDLIIGDASGFLTFWKGTADPLIYHAGRKMIVKGVPVHHQAGVNGSIQGPNERRQGFLRPTLGDWDGDMAMEIITNDVTGLLKLYRKSPGFQSDIELSEPLTFKKNGADYLSAWRSRPAIIPSCYNYKGTQRPVLLHIDWDGDLAVAVTKEKGSVEIEEVEKLRYENGKPIRLCGPAGLWGRVILSTSEWGGDGKWHVVFGANYLNQDNYSSEILSGASPFLLENVGTNEAPVFKAARPIRLRDGRPIDMGLHNAFTDQTRLGTKTDLIIGAEDGKIYYFPQSRLQDTESPLPPDLSLLGDDELLAYALTPDALLSKGGELSFLPRVSVNHHGYLEITFTPYRDDLVYEVQQSTDIHEWTRVEIIEGGLDFPVIINSTLKAPDSSRIFIRLRVFPKKEYND